MPRRWWGRTAGPAIVVALLAGSNAIAALDGEADAPRWQLVARTTDGAVVLSLPLTDGRFSLAYRNSLYGSPAVEHFSVAPDGRLTLVGLAATDPAILQEYYGATDPLRRAAVGTWTGWWQTATAEPVQLATLTVAATRHGERTLVTSTGERLALWQAVRGDDPGLTFRAEPAG